MHTQTHLLLGLAAFGRGPPRTAVAAAGGALLPDVPALVMAGWALAVQRRDAGDVFGESYYSDAWQAVLAPWHSIPLWGLALVLAFAVRSPAARAFAAAGLLHIAFDLPVHADDPHRHLWPLSDWRFFSPVSYWDPDQGGRVAGALEIAGGLALVALLWRRWRATPARVGLGVMVVLYLVQAVLMAAWSF